MANEPSSWLCANCVQHGDIQGQILLHWQIMELAAVVHACCLPSEKRMMLMSATNHIHDLDLDWQSMPVHLGPHRDKQRDTETDDASYECMHVRTHAQIAV